MYAHRDGQKEKMGLQELGTVGDLRKRLATRRDEAQKALLDIFATMTGLPIGLYEVRDGELKGIFSEGSLANFEPHCKLIQTFPGGKEACERDQCNRAKQSLKKSEESLMLCHAGLYNQSVPVRINGEIRAVLLYGEMQVEDEKRRGESLERHNEAVQRLDLDKEQATELRQKLLAAKAYTPDKLNELKKSLPKLEAYLLTLIDEEDRLHRDLENATHEIQTRLQAVVAEAENYVLEMSDLDEQERQKRAEEVLYRTLALDTVVQSFGRFSGEDYRFRKKKITELIYEAERLYYPEARRKGVDIHIDLKPVKGKPPVANVSHRHLQIAFNNLLHNAVKYSFFSGPSRQRYIKVEGNLKGQYYQIMFENYGVGILPDEIKSGVIFEDGYQGKLTHGEYRTGSGKGLHYVREVIDRHHGQIIAESTPMGKMGALGQPYLNRITVLLPLDQEER